MTQIMSYYIRCTNSSLCALFDPVNRAVLPCRVQPSTARLCPCVPLRARIVTGDQRLRRPSSNQHRPIIPLGS